MRTHYCGHLNKSLAGQTVELCGWVAWHRLAQLVGWRNQNKSVRHPVLPLAGSPALTETTIRHCLVYDSRMEYSTDGGR